MSRVNNADTLRGDVDEVKKEDKPKEEIKGPKILNGKSELPFGLKLLPDYLMFKYVQAGTAVFATFTIINTKPDKQAFKVKATKNICYRAKPSVGFIKSGEKVHVKVAYLGANPPNSAVENREHVAVYHVSAGNAKTYKEAFAKKTDGVHHFYCHHKTDGMFPVDDPKTEDQNQNQNQK